MVGRKANQTRTGRIAGTSVAKRPNHARRGIAVAPRSPRQPGQRK